MISFTIPGEPRGKGRPRFARQGAFVRTYTPEETASYENLVKVMYLNTGGAKHAGPMRVSMTFYFPIPQSKPKKTREQMANGRIRPTIKRDIDNCIKAVLDGLNGVAFDDDKQVVFLDASKWYSDNPRTEVVLSEVLASKEGGGTQ